jgi:hypothetical protein
MSTWSESSSEALKADRPQRRTAPTRHAAMIRFLDQLFFIVFLSIGKKYRLCHASDAVIMKGFEFCNYAIQNRARAAFFYRNSGRQDRLQTRKKASALVKTGIGEGRVTNSGPFLEDQSV